MSNIQTLREQMFATLQGIKDGSISVDKAKAICQVGDVIVASAKIEVDFIRATGGGDSEFLTIKDSKATPTGRVTVNGNSTVHKLR
jgi:hypothetical protein